MNWPTADERRFGIQVRNPLFLLPSVKEIEKLPLDQRLVLSRLLMDLYDHADKLAETSWKRRKGPMAAYWRAVATYAKHASRVFKREAAAHAAKEGM